MAQPMAIPVMPNVMTAEDYRASHIFQIATNPDGSPLTAEQADAQLAARRAKRTKLIFWGVAILGGGGLLLYALTRK